MDTRLLIAAGSAAFLLSIAPAPAASATIEGASQAGVLLARCPDGPEHLAVPALPEIADGPFVGSVAILDAALWALSEGCDGLVLAPSPGGAPESGPGVVAAQDAAVWSRGTPPAVRASDTP